MFRACDPNNVLSFTVYYSYFSFILLTLHVYFHSAIFLLSIVSIS